MSRQSHRDRIYDLLQTRIQTGEVGWQDRLVDTTLAADLGVSRMPVRDALMRLAHEGYLASSTRGFTLPELTPRQILEIFELRRLIEPRAAALATYALTEEDLEAMARAVALSESTIESGDVELLFNASEALRRTWIMAIPNIELRDTILRYMAQIQAVRMATLRDAASHRILVTFHRQMLTAFASRKGADVELLILRFVLAGEESYLRAKPVQAPSPL